MRDGIGEGNVLRYGEPKDDRLVYGILMLSRKLSGFTGSGQYGGQRETAERQPGEAITASYDR
jgi:hypothetical protein